MSKKTKEKEAVTEHLPALAIEVRGEVVTSNAEEFRRMVKEWLAGFKVDLTTDEDFAQAEDDVKTLKEKETAVTEAKAKALQDAEQLHTLFTLLDDTGEDIRQARLNLEKRIKTKKEEIRASIVNEAVASIADKHGVKFRAKIEAAIKGKRSIETIREAANKVATDANELIEANTVTLKRFEAANGRGLLYDWDRLVLTESEALLESELTRRADAQKAEEEKKRLEAEAAKLRAEAAEKAKVVEAPQPVASNNAWATAPAAPMERPPQPSEPVQFESQKQEAQRFLQTVAAAFAPVKEARGKLAHPANVEAAAEFAKSLSQAWAALQEVAK